MARDDAENLTSSRGDEGERHREASERIQTTDHFTRVCRVSELGEENADCRGIVGVRWAKSEVVHGHWRSRLRVRTA
jgi:hypothetical protein